MNTNYTEIKHLLANNLSLHSELIRIYGDTKDSLELQLDIEANGILVPLVASIRTSTITVVSGGRRLRSAINLSIETVPVICYPFESEEAEKHFILSANRDRPKTKYQQLLEGKEWELFEKQAAAFRRQHGLNQRWKKKDEGIDDNEHEYYPVVLLNDYRSATRVTDQSDQKKWERAVDKVGARIGMSGRTYERAKPVIDKCEKLRESGKELEAAALEAYLESVGINPASNFLKAPNCDEVLNLVGSGEAKTIKEAILKANRVNKPSAVVEGAIFFFPDYMLRSKTYVHSGRVVGISNMTATVCFRDKLDLDLYSHQYKCDELLTLEREGETRGQIRLRDKMNKLLAHENAEPTERCLLNRFLSAVVCTHEEVNWVDIIEWRIIGKTQQG